MILIKQTFLVVFLVITGVLYSQESLTTNQWQEDVLYLQERVHTDFPFLFKKIKQTEWDAAIEQFHKEIPNLQPHQIKIGLTRMVSMFEYGHTQIPFSTIAKDAVLPINLYHFEDGIFIEGAQKEYTKLIGAKLLKIGNTPVDDALKAIRPVVPVENDQYLKAYGLRFLTVPAVLHTQRVISKMSNEVTITVEKDGNVFKYTLASVPLKSLSRDYCLTIPNEEWVSARSQNEIPLYLKHLQDKFYFFEYIPSSKTVYVRQSSVFNDDEETLADFYKRLFAFIDSNDVRLNGGGNNYNNKPLIKGIMARPEINKKGTFFYIIGRNTFSAAQNLTNEIDQYTEAILVGEPTSENLNFYGDAKKVTLPNSKINAYLSYAWWQDRAPWDNKDWTIPNIAVTMTFDQYVSNQDPVLDAALNYTEAGFILNPMEYLTELFLAGKYAEVKIEGAKIAKDPAYKYYDFQDEFGKAGYRLFQYGDKEAGLFILQLVAELYPESVGALYNLASAQEQMNLLDQAKENYKKIIEIEPNGSTGTTAKNKLKNMK